ncbi:MAG: hypothetical protein ACREQL_03620 [Candidatus Binatia bacterium]
MKREPLVLAAALALLSGCATLVHGPYQDVRIDSNPPGATATISAQLSERGPAFVDEQKERKVTTPATVRLQRDNTYRVEIEKPGYKIASKQIRSEYDWFWGQIACGPCEAVAALPSYDMSEHNAAVRVLESAFYEWPKGFIGGWGKGLRIFSPDALLGSTFKLKEKDSGYWSGWTGLGTPEISANLEPGS